MKTFVFDVDGVICIGKSFGYALEVEHGIPRERLAPFFEGPFLECILGRRDLRSEIAPYLPSWGWNNTVDAFLAFWFSREDVVCSRILSCVQTLRERGYRCVIGTNQERYRSDYLQVEMGLARRFDGFFASHALGARKPMPEFFAGVGALLDQPKAKIVLVDDSAANVAAAQTAGWQAIHYTGPADIAQIWRREDFPVDGLENAAGIA